MRLTFDIFPCTLQDHLSIDKEPEIPGNQRGMNSFLIIIPGIIKKKKSIRNKRGRRNSS
jgi:hypothetical protein